MTAQECVAAIAKKLEEGPYGWLDMDFLVGIRKEMNVDPDSFYVEIMRQSSPMGWFELITGDELLKRKPREEDVFEDELYLVLE